MRKCWTWKNESYIMAHMIWVISFDMVYSILLERMKVDGPWCRGSEVWFKVYRRRLCKWSLLYRPLWIKIFISNSMWRFKSKVDGPWEWNWTVRKAEKCQNVKNMDHVLWPSILRNSDRSLSSPWTVHFGLQPLNLIQTKYFENFDHKIHHIFI